jgi:hypothetical protein
MPFAPLPATLALEEKEACFIVRDASRPRVCRRKLVIGAWVVVRIGVECLKGSRNNGPYNAHR